MDSRELRYILEILETGNLTTAASNLYTTQPSLSRTVSTLEKKLGTKIFDKSDHPWKLTVAGEVYIDFARKVLIEEDLCLAEIERLKNNQIEYMRLGVMPFEERYFLSKNLSAMKKICTSKYKNFKLKYIIKHSQEVENLLLSEQVKFSLILAPAKNPQIKFIPVKEYKILIVLGKEHPFAQNYTLNIDGSFPSIDLAKFKHEDFILMEKGHTFNKTVSDICKKAGFKPKVTQEVKSSEFAYALAKENFGATFLLDKQILFNDKTDDVCCFEIRDNDNNPIAQTIAIAFLENKKLSDKEQFFLDVLQNHLADY